MPCSLSSLKRFQQALGMLAQRILSLIKEELCKRPKGRLCRAHVAQNSMQWVCTCRSQDGWTDAGNCAAGSLAGHAAPVPPVIAAVADGAHRGTGLGQDADSDDDIPEIDSGSSGSESGSSPSR